jgi:transcription initiation factor IIE alpha subunit
MELLTAGKAPLDALADAFDVEPSDVSDIMRGLEDEGVAFAIREAESKKKIAWVFAKLETTVVIEMQRLSYWTAAELAAQTGSTVSAIRQCLYGLRDESVAKQVKNPTDSAKLVWTLVDGSRAADEAVQALLSSGAAAVSRPKAAMLAALKSGPLTRQGILIKMGIPSHGGRYSQYLSELENSGLISCTRVNKTKIWRLVESPAASKPTSPQPAQSVIPTTLTAIESLFLKALQERPMLVSEIAASLGLPFSVGSHFRVVESLKKSGLVTFSLNNRGNRVWRLA